MKWKEFAKDYLSFSRRDRIGILVLVFLIILVFVAPAFISNKSHRSTQPLDTAWIHQLKKLEIKDSSKHRDYTYQNEERTSSYQYDRNIVHTKGELFEFDPNTLSTKDWQKLGMRDKTIQTIQNYLSKGGRFKKAEDLKKIYGLFPDEYERIAPYIRINESLPISDFSKNETPKNYNPSSSRLAAIDVNIADTTAFIALPGIGSKLATRIVAFRDKLGGFYAINQIAETFGLPDSTFQKIKQYLKLENNTVRKININTATLDELKSHPYIRFNLAKPIIAYREQHGLFSKAEDLKKIMVVTDELYNKLSPYLIVQ